MLNSIKHVINGNKLYNCLQCEKKTNKELMKYWHDLVETFISNAFFKVSPKTINFKNSLKERIFRNDEFISFANDFTEHLQAVHTMNNSLNEACDTLEDKIGILSLYTDDKVLHDNIDTSLFLTEEFLLKFTEAEMNNVFDENLIHVFNKLINEEKIYVKGIYAAMEYCKNKKNKKKALYIQLYENLLTNKGKVHLKSILE